MSKQDYKSLRSWLRLKLLPISKLFLSQFVFYGVYIIIKNYKKKEEIDVL
jgi:hypothetical protein